MMHPQGVNVGLSDGSTHFVSESISEDVFRTLGTKRGGEIASLEDSSLHSRHPPISKRVVLRCSGLRFTRSREKSRLIQ